MLLWMEGKRVLQPNTGAWHNSLAVHLTVFIQSERIPGIFMVLNGRGYMLKILLIILALLKWIYYMKHNNVIPYFKTSCVCMLIYWSIIIITLARKSAMGVVYFGLLSAMLYGAALVLGFKRGNDYLKIINKYYPHVMRNYNESKDYKNKVKKLEQELKAIKEQAKPVVVEAIIKREMIKPITYFHIEMIVLTTIALFPAYLN